MATPLQEIKVQLTSLEAEMQQVPLHYGEVLEKIHPDNLPSAINLLKYLVLRKTDIQHLQYELHRNGLSSLASCESHTHRQIQVTLERLGVEFPEADACTLAFGCKKIENSSRKLFGNKLAEWPSSVMVTMDPSFLNEPGFVEELLKNGMGVARINCAHDDISSWDKIVEEIRLASKNTGVPCKIHVDLAGPKIRTVLLKQGKEEGRVPIFQGCKIWLSEEAEGFGASEIVISPNESGVIQNLKIGDRVFFDDGLILGIVEKKERGGVQLIIERISSKKPFLKAEKGINFPDSLLDISSLTDFDRECLPWVVSNADTLGFSFVREAEDLAELRTEMKSLSSTIPQIILKIETSEAVVNLPDLLLEGMVEPVFGVMIARGDLAVEVGFERLVEIQEEISWLCEAAHVPVIWATQVLESLRKHGIASRAEITDAGRAAMAECIMINKGGHILEVLTALRDIAKRSRALRVKNRLTFRPLKIAENFLSQFE